MKLTIIIAFLFPVFCGAQKTKTGLPRNIQAKVISIDKLGKRVVYGTGITMQGDSVKFSVLGSKKQIRNGWVSIGTWLTIHGRTTDIKGEHYEYSITVNY